jgi:NTP pyrophosphatase (non-canonical NTP hydrolase)
MTNPLHFKDTSNQDLVDQIQLEVTIGTLIDKIMKWHEDRNLIEGSTDKDQVLKLQQELGELSDSVCKQKDMKDDLGDMMVIMLNIMKRNNITMEECLETAYNDIKDRKGKMIDGIFVKFEEKSFNMDEGEE